MGQTKFSNLQDASRKMRNSYINYEKECREFITEFYNGLITYLGCDKKDLVWLSYEEAKDEEELKKNNIKEVTPERLLILLDNAYYRFVFRIKLETQSVDVILGVKINGEKLLFHIGDVIKEINKSNHEEYDKLVEETYNLTKKYLENNFEEFIGNSPKRSLGFKLS